MAANTNPPLEATIYVAGHRGLVGSAIVRALKSRGYSSILTATSKELDLKEQAAVRQFYADKKPEYMFIAAAKVGGIQANSTYPAEFIYDNLMIEANLINGAYEAGVRKLLLLGSTCIYPKMAPQPLEEKYLLSGQLEPTNEWYAVAKIAGIKLCQAYRRQHNCDFIAAMPTNLYGPGDNFNLDTSHVLPALIRKFHEAKLENRPEVVVWGTGTPRREFLHVDDCAAACLHLMEHYTGEEIINIGVGRDLTINELAGTIADIVGFRGKIVNDTSKPDGTPRKLVAVDRIKATGWQAGIPLKKGIADTYRWYQEQAQ
ncbi:MAG: GDP-L-fucose synthase [Gammaproteobacteria bacterium]|nr:GDP-L-fucose synthase [Gammaproteobacteria bacterium]